MLAGNNLDNNCIVLAGNNLDNNCIVLAGNNLDNNCIVELLLLLANPKAPRITQLDLAMNTSLSWRCTRALSMALGAMPGPEDSVPGDALAGEQQVRAAAAASAAVHTLQHGAGRVFCACVRWGKCRYCCRSGSPAQHAYAAHLSCSFSFAMLLSGSYVASVKTAAAQGACTNA